MLRWLERKAELREDVVLIGRGLDVALAWLEGRSFEYFLMTRDACGSDLRQRLEMRDGAVVRVDAPAVAAARRGVPLLLDGIDRAEPNALVVLHELLENRRIGLDDGMLEAQPGFIVVAIAATHKTLDPPLRSRFAARVVTSSSYEEEYCLADAVAAIGGSRARAEARSRGRCTTDEEPLGLIEGVLPQAIEFAAKRVPTNKRTGDTALYKALAVSRRRVARDLVVDHLAGARCLLVVGPRGAGKATVVRAFAALIGYEPLWTLACHADLATRDLAQRRHGEGSSTTWIDTPLTTALRTGGLVVLDGIDRLPEVELGTLASHGFLGLPDGSRLEAKPGFRLVATATRRMPGGFQTTHVLPNLTPEEQRAILGGPALQFLGPNPQPRQLVALARASREANGNLRSAIDSAFGIQLRWGADRATLRQALDDLAPPIELSSSSSSLEEEEKEEQDGCSFLTPPQSRALKRLAASRGHALLVGNQGVGKNLVVDTLFSEERRDYIQLHRDSTVSQLLLTPEISPRREFGWRPSPIVTAARRGRVVVVDEADKAPPEVARILKALLSDVVPLSLPDGSRLEPSPGFRIIVLANRPGYPFTGIDLYAECADLFSTVIVLDPPDPESELRVATSIAPNVDSRKLRAIVDAFAELRALADAGRLAYPYSTRDLCRVARHLHHFPDDLHEALEDLLAFEHPKIRDTVRRVFDARLQGLEDPDDNFLCQVDEHHSSEQPNDDDDDHASQQQQQQQEEEEEEEEEPVDARATEDEEGGGAEDDNKGENNAQHQDENGGFARSSSSSNGQEMRLSSVEVVEEATTTRDECRADTGDIYGTLTTAYDVALVRGILSAEARVWAKRQTHGELDDGRLVDAVLGDANVCRRRILAKRPGRFKVVVDVSATTYEADALDGRLRRVLRVVATLAEALKDWSLSGFSGSGPEIAFKRWADQSPGGGILARRIAEHAQHCRRGDATLAATRAALAKSEDPVLLVVALDAYLATPPEQPLNEFAAALREATIPVKVLLVADASLAHLQTSQPHSPTRLRALIDKLPPGTAIPAADSNNIGAALEAALRPT